MQAVCIERASAYRIGHAFEVIVWPRVVYLLHVDCALGRSCVLTISNPRAPAECWIVAYLTGQPLSQIVGEARVISEDFTPTKMPLRVKMFKVKWLFMIL